MITIICAECGRAPFGATAQGLFRCDSCAFEISTRDLVLDPCEAWAVDSAGTLGYLPAPDNA
ncbi:hypothetical protein ACIQK6_23740 [Streptomyces sp. NPDC091682]|uniref:hypothetical protein n=1 Tax=Streptomyces sp. NPDC091682 TaxID=3366005 RepID=UPI00380E780C